MPKVLVTGGAGFIGSHTADALVERGYEVRIMDSLQPRVHPRGKPDYLNPKAEFFQGDVARRADWEAALEGVEAVFHFAAYQDYLPDFSTFVHVNAESMALLFELIVAQRLPIRRIVYASSQAVAGEGKYRCERDGVVFPGPRTLAELEQGRWDATCPRCGAALQDWLLIDEAVASPHTAYGIAKYSAELLARSLGDKYGIPTVGMRYTYVQGPRNAFHNFYSGVCRKFAVSIRNGVAPVVYEDGRQLRDYVNVFDVVEANLLAFESAAADPVLNVGGGAAISVLEFARLMLEAMNSPLEASVPGVFRVGDTRHTVSDISRIQRLGWRPKFSVKDNIEQFLSWFQSQADVPAGEDVGRAEESLFRMGVLKRPAVG